MDLDINYFSKLTEYLNGKWNDSIQDLNSLKVVAINNKDKLIFHLKHHIDNGNYPAVEFNNDYSMFKVYTSASAPKKEFDPNSIDPEFWIILRKKAGYKRQMDLTISIAEEKRIKSKKAKPTKKNNEYTGERIEY